MYEGLAFPDISPIAVQLGAFGIRWYSLAYIFGILIGWFLVTKMSREMGNKLKKKQIDDLLVYAVLGVLLGGRLGYVFFYNFSYYMSVPWRIPFVWEGGMSFHGGVVGLGIAVWVFAKRNKVPFLFITDMIAVVAPAGLFLGRLANFINAELYGRVTRAVPWAIRFPQDNLPRHPSQLYEAGLEGLLLFIVLNLLWWKVPNVRNRYGMISGIFLILYGIFRFMIEFFREPDIQVGFLWRHTTMGQMLCIPMIMLGAYLIYYSKKEKPHAEKN